MKSNSVLRPSIYALLLMSLASPVVASDRFSPPALSSSVESFNKRSSSNGLNVSFILARVLNESRLIHRAADDIRSTTSIFSNQDSNGATLSNSVYIPPGTRANTIIVINQNDGDSYAIHR